MQAEHVLEQRARAHARGGQPLPGVHEPARAVRHPRNVHEPAEEPQHHVGAQDDDGLQEVVLREVQDLPEATEEQQHGVQVVAVPEAALVVPALAEERVRVGEELSRGAQLVQHQEEVEVTHGVLVRVQLRHRLQQLLP